MLTEEDDVNPIGQVMPSLSPKHLRIRCEERLGVCCSWEMVLDRLGMKEEEGLDVSLVRCGRLIRSEEEAVDVTDEDVTVEVGPVHVETFLPHYRDISQ